LKGAGRSFESNVKMDMAYIKFLILEIGLTSNKFYDVEKTDTVTLKFKASSLKSWEYRSQNLF
jgi:hypothetical protein